MMLHLRHTLLIRDTDNAVQCNFKLSGATLTYNVNSLIIQFVWRFCLIGVKRIHEGDQIRGTFIGNFLLNINKKGKMMPLSTLHY